MDDKPQPLPLTREEFGLLVWAQRRSGARRMPLFVRQALCEAIGRVLSSVAAHGGKIPAGVAKEYEQFKTDCGI